MFQQKHGFNLKGATHAKTKNIFFLLPVVIFISLHSFDMSCLVLAILATSDFCIVSNIKGLNGARLVVLTEK